MASILLPKERSIYFSTSALGKDAILSADRSRLTITLDHPLYVSSGAIGASISVQTASIWHTSPNISAALGNNKFDYLINGVQQPQITIVDGLYSLSGLNTFLSKEFVLRGQDASLIQITGDEATQKCILDFKANVQFDSGPVGSVCSILGFTPGALYPSLPQPINDFPVYGAEQAAFNTVNEFAIVSDIVSNGIPINNTGVNLLAVIPIPSGSVGRQVNYQPYIPTLVDAGDLRGKTRSSFYIGITDQNGKPLAQTEDWAVLLTIKEHILITSERMPMLDV